MCKSFEAMIDEESRKESIRPRKKGTEFDFTRRKTIKDKQNKLNSLAEKGCRKKRNLVNERQNKETISRKRHERNSCKVFDEQESICNKCDLYLECLSWTEDEKISKCPTM